MTTSAPRSLAGPSRPGLLGRLGRSLLRIATPVAIFLLAVVVLAMLFENRLIFFPIVYPEGDWRPTGFKFEDVNFQAADGVQLHGWFVPHDRPTAAIVFCHGNGGNITHRADVARLLHDRAGAAVLLFDYRGYGRSAGQPNEAGVLADARAARDWLAQRLNRPPQQIVMMGESLGGAVAVDVAARDGAAGLILENTFSSLADVAAYHYPWLPVRMLLRTRLNSIDTIRQYHGPLLQSHGQHDTIVPYAYGQKLFEAANSPKQFISYPGDDHNDARPTSYYDKVGKFLREVRSKNDE